MYSEENISVIFDFRNQTPTSYEYEGKRPSNELILNALDLIRKFVKSPEPEINLGIEGINTVIKFIWNIGDFGFVQYTLSENYLKLYVMDNNSNVLVNDVELDHNDYDSIDFITRQYIRRIRGIDSRLGEW